MLELERRFQFLINKLENNTYYISELIQNVNSSTTKSAAVGDAAADYDSYGAAKYIIVVVLAYAFGIIFFIGSQVRSTKKVSDEVDEVNAEKILRSMENEIFTREVLEKLSDKAHREKAWNIYRQGKSPLRRSSASAPAFICSEQSMENIDRDAVENIQKKLKNLNRQDNSRQGFEIETVNEVLGFKSRFGFNKTLKSFRNKKVKFPVIKNLFKNKKRSSKATINNAAATTTVITPLLVLQTDDDGLKMLRESRKTSRKSILVESKSNQSLNAPLNSTAVSSLESSLNSSLVSSNNSSSNATGVNAAQAAKRRSTSVQFDHCEISEQITTV